MPASSNLLVFFWLYCHLYLGLHQMFLTAISLGFHFRFLRWVSPLLSPLPWVPPNVPLWVLLPWVPHWVKFTLGSMELESGSRTALKLVAPFNSFLIMINMMMTHQQGHPVFPC